MANFFALLIGSPLVTAVVLVNVGADATATMTSIGERIERIVERTWAILVIDVAIALMMRASFESMMTSDAGSIALGTFATFLAAMLVYAEPFAALETSVQTLTLVPFALLRSLMLAWVNIARVFSLFAIQLVISIAEIYLLQSVAPKGGRVFDIVDLAYVTVMSAVLAALFAVAYLDTAAQEQRLRE
jgi:hypothetical protein